MGYYIIVTLVIIFICFIIGVAIKWEFGFPRWHSPITKTIKKHTKETTAVSATDVTSLPPGFSDAATHDAVIHSSITSSSQSFDNYNITDHPGTGSFDTNSDNSGYDNGGYDSGGGYDGGGSS